MLTWRSTRRFVERYSPFRFYISRSHSIFAAGRDRTNYARMVREPRKCGSQATQVSLASRASVARERYKCCSPAMQVQFARHACTVCAPQQPANITQYVVNNPFSATFKGKKAG